MSTPFDHVRVVTHLQTDPDLARMIERRAGALASDLGEPGSTAPAAYGRLGSTAATLDKRRFVVIHESIIVKFEYPVGDLHKEGWWNDSDTPPDRDAILPQLRLMAQAGLALGIRAAALVAASDPENLRTFMLHEQDEEATEAALMVATFLGDRGDTVHSPSPWSKGAVTLSMHGGFALPDAIETFFPQTVRVAIQGTNDRPQINLHPTSHPIEEADPISRMRAIAEMPAHVRTILENVR